MPRTFVMRIDAHQHFWRYDPAEYPWINPEWPIRRDFLPRDLEPLLAAANLDGCVAVQARQTLEETRWLLSLSAEHPFIRGVVGWVDLRAANVADQLAEFARNPRLVGVRHIVQDEPDDEFMLRGDFQRGLERVKEFDLTYDILIYARQLPAAIKLVRKYPNHRFVLDHAAKPGIRGRVSQPWREQIRELAASPNVFCKLSGLVTEADWQTWRPEQFAPYVDTVLEAFGANRLMYGSDWPVCLLAADYEQVFALASSFCSQFSTTEQEQVFGETARRFYRLP